MIWTVDVDIQLFILYEVEKLQSAEKKDQFYCDQKPLNKPWGKISLLNSSQVQSSYHIVLKDELLSILFIQNECLLYVLQILMNVKNKILFVHKTLSALTHQVPLFAQVG